MLAIISDPASVAKCRDVLPFASDALTSAPASIRYSTISMFPISIAIISGGSTHVVISTLAQACTSTWTASKCPPAIATCRGAAL